MKKFLVLMLFYLTSHVDYSHAANLHGGLLSDVIEGTSEDDYIRAGLSDDVINGKGGSDRLEGEWGKDVFVFDAETAFTGTDIILDFTLGEDRIDLTNLIANQNLDLNFSEIIRFSNTAKDTEIAVRMNNDGEFHVVAILENVLLSDTIEQYIAQDVLVVSKEQQAKTYLNSIANRENDRLKLIKEIRRINKEQK